MRKNLDADFWNDKYLTNAIGWDLGNISTPLKTYIDQLIDKDLKILIPGCGNSYEAEYLYNKGFKNVYVADISTTALENLKNRVSEIPEEKLLHMNFFDIKQQFDLILEQTFFCAIDPSLRAKYAKQVGQLLKPKGKLVGVLFNTPLNTEQPPFGGNKEEYLNYFEPFFDKVSMTPCYNSEASRKGMELFIQLQK